MNSIKKCNAPEDSFLFSYATETNAYIDSFTTNIPTQVNLEKYIQAFYTTRLFKLERLLLKYLASAPLTDVDVNALAANNIQHFALWNVVARTDQQIFMNAGRTSSWLCVASNEKGTQLYFGSAVKPMIDKQTGERKMGMLFTALLGFHKLYSRALLWSAKKRLA